MDATLLKLGMFWRDPVPYAAGNFPGDVSDFPELRGHVIFETSGSSGTPKWIAISKEALLISAETVNEHLAVTHSSCWGLALPPHHVGGFGVAARAFAAGCKFEHFNQRWGARAFGAWNGESNITHLSLVPTQVHDLVTAGITAPASLVAVVVGGGRLDAATGQAARVLGWPILASYGMTETSSQIATQSLNSLAADFQPTPLKLLPIWQAESSQGLLRIRGAALFSGTLINDQGAWRYRPRVDEWHQTNDLAKIENDFLTPLGRADSRVKILGELVDLETIERELSDLSENKLAPGSFVIVAVPDDRAENLLVPVFDSTVDQEIIDQVMAAYAAQSPGFRRLKPPVVLAKFPLSQLGKPQRAEISAAIRR
ncbi:MAG: AMP-binding protein [Gloeobacteraceae cyanobacterium ES-bin-144]|nr:AMP-binding protein [Verrucomicrobiales bacterium]